MNEPILTGGEVAIIVFSFAGIVAGMVFAAFGLSRIQDREAEESIARSVAARQNAETLRKVLWDQESKDFLKAMSLGGYDISPSFGVDVSCSVASLQKFPPVRKPHRIAYPYRVASQLYRFGIHRLAIHRGKSELNDCRREFYELAPETQKAWLDIARFVLSNGRHDLRDWKGQP